MKSIAIACSGCGEQIVILYKNSDRKDQGGLKVLLDEAHVEKVEAALEEQKRRTKETNRAYYSKHRKRLLASVTRYQKRNPEVIRLKNKLYKRKNKAKMKAQYDVLMQDPEKFKRAKIGGARRRARKNDLTFDLTVAGIDWPTHCPVFGYEFNYCQQVAGGGELYKAPSIDRIDNTKGYTLENVQVISYMANSMKRDATEEQLVMFANWVLDS